ncbi:hypothetical protein T439DRAFT_383674, partial [Meredithblackwellia eburnea MCA 4105]
MDSDLYSAYFPVQRPLVPTITEQRVDGETSCSVFDKSWRHLTTAINDVKAKGFTEWKLDVLPQQTKPGIHAQSSNNQQTNADSQSSNPRKSFNDLPPEIRSKIYLNLNRKLQNEKIQEPFGTGVWTARLEEDGIILLPSERAVDEILTFDYAHFVKGLAMENIQADWITRHYVYHPESAPVLVRQFTKLRSLHLNQVAIPAAFLSKDNFPDLVRLSTTLCQFVDHDNKLEPRLRLTPITVSADTGGIQALIVSPGTHQIHAPKKLQAIRVRHAEDFRILRACLQIQHISMVWISPTTVWGDNETNPFRLSVVQARQTFVEQLTFEEVDDSLSRSLVTLSASSLRFLQIISPPGLTDSVGNRLVQLVEIRNRINPLELP